MFKHFKTFVLCAILTLFTTGAFAQSKVTIGEPSWPGAKIMANIIGQVITTRLGGEVGYSPGANAVIFEAMDGGRGDIDVHPDVWLPNQSSFTDEYVDQKNTVALSSGSYKGESGFCTPTYMANDHNIKSVFDLGTPEAQKLFDSDGSGKGEIWVGAAGWASTNVHKVKVRDYGIETFLEPTTEDETVFYARLKDLVAEKKGVVFYCYKPHYVHALYDLIIIEEPEFDSDQYTIVQPDQDAEWYEKSKITTGDQVKTVRVAHSKSLESRNPAAASFLANINMDSDELSKLTYQVVVQEQEIESTVSKWIDANSKLVDSWLGL